jgi:hypothetical protein
LFTKARIAAALIYLLFILAFITQGDFFVEFLNKFAISKFEQSLLNSSVNTALFLYLVLSGLLSHLIIHVFLIKKFWSSYRGISLRSVSFLKLGINIFITIVLTFVVSNFFLSKGYVIQNEPLAFISLSAMIYFMTGALVEPFKFLPLVFFVRRSKQ